MKTRLSFLGTFAITIALTLSGVLNGVNPVQALMPLPIQPWDPDTDIRVDSTALGAPILVESLISAEFGARIPSTSWYSSGPVSPPDKEMADGTQKGGLLAYYDLFCDGAIDTLAGPLSVPPNYVREPWVEQTTALTGGLEGWLLSAGPPYALKWRLLAQFTVFYAAGMQISISGGIAVNLLDYTFPWATKLGMTSAIVGNQANPPSTLCADSTANVNSHITGIFSNPPPEGDSGAPCAGAGCADKQIHGFWTQGRVQLAATGSTTIEVTKRVLNNGPATGNFVDIWEVEAPTGVTAEWSTAVAVYRWQDPNWVADPSASEAGALCYNNTDDWPDDDFANDGCPAVGTAEKGAECSNIIDENSLDTATEGHEDDNGVDPHNQLGLPPAGDADVNGIYGYVNDGCPAMIRADGGGAEISFPETNLPVSVPFQYVGGLNLTCTAPGDYLVTLKDFTYPQAGTQDNDLASNVALYAVRVICGSPAATETDKKVITLRKTLVDISPLDPPLWPNLNLPLEEQPTGEHVQLVVDQTATVSVDATEINLSTVAVPGLETFVAETPSGTPPGIIAEFLSVSGDTVIPGGLQWIESEQPGGPGPAVGVGQFDVSRDLLITCLAPGIYPVAVKVIDMPIGVGEKKPADNVRSNVIKVWCWASEADKLAADDGIDDGAGLVPHWTVLAPSNDIPELRKPFDPNNPPATALRADTRYGERTVDLQCFWVDSTGSTDLNGDTLISPWESQLDPNRPYGLDDDHDCLADPKFTQPSHPVDEKDSKDTDGDGVSDAIETVMGSNPANPASVPEATLGASATKHDTCTDGLNNDGNGGADTDPECSNADTDGDGWASWFETAAGSNPNDAGSTPENLAAPTTCNDGVDNDGDYTAANPFIDGADPGCIEPGVDLCSTVAPGSMGALVDHNVHNDEDCDGLKDGIEKAFGSNPMLVDSDDDGATDWVEMMQSTNPGDPDTDGDGLRDIPDDDYTAAPYGGAKNSVPESVLANACNDALDSDGDTVVNDGCPPRGAVEIACANAIDDDNDGYVNDGCLQQGAPESVTPDYCHDGVDNDTDGRIDALDPSCATGDTDSDGFADVDERSLDSNPYSDIYPPLNSVPEGWIVPDSLSVPTKSDCLDILDNDKDSKVDGMPANPRCPSKVGAWDKDGDGYSNNDEDGLGSVAYDEAGEPADSDDNCPYIYNPDQANNDGRPSSSGPFIAGAFRSNPTGDTWGDACDSDDDNDRYADAGELQRKVGGVPAPTDPYNKDTDGDGCGDGVESILAKDPLNPGALWCGALNVLQQYFFRACHFNLPDATKYPGYNPGYSIPPGTPEMDPDGDGVLCPYAAPTGDKDADNGSSAFASLCPLCAEIIDTVEIEGYNTAPAVSDTDGDACEDWCEICDVNGDRLCTGLDRVTILKCVYASPHPDPVTDYVCDVDKDRSITGLDATLCAKNSSLVKPPGVCWNPTYNTDMQRLLP